MKIVAILRTQDYRGDHSADVEIAVEPHDGESVQEFADRIFARMCSVYTNRAETSVIELRAIVDRG